MQDEFSCFLCHSVLYAKLQGRGEGKLTRAVYFAPVPPGYQSKIILLHVILLILKYLNVEMYQVLIRMG